MEENQHLSSEETSVPCGEEKEAEIKLAYFRGIPFQGPPFDISILGQVVEFKPDPTDIFVVTYPKCGTTWAQYIVWEIINRGAPPPGPNKMMFTYFPYLEATGLEKINELPRPRLMKTHLPFQLQPYHPSAKYIYVARNPWDCCVSYYHHMQGLLEGQKLSFEKFLDHFVQGRLPAGDFFDHVFSWYAHKNDSNVLFLTYENMTVDRKGTMFKIARFLGDKYYDVLQNNEQVLDNCLKHSEFKYVKDLRMFLARDMFNQDKLQHQTRNAAALFRETMGAVDKDNVDLEKFREWEFFRKGIVGDWKNYFSERHMKRFNDYIARKVGSSSIEDMWILRQQFH